MALTPHPSRVAQFFQARRRKDAIIAVVVGMIVGAYLGFSLAMPLGYIWAHSHGGAANADDYSVLAGLLGAVAMAPGVGWTALWLAKRRGVLYIFLGFSVLLIAVHLSGVFGKLAKIISTSGEVQEWTNPTVARDLPKSEAGKSKH